MKKSYIIAFWSPFQIPSMSFCTDFFSPILKEYGNIQCLNCQHFSGKRTFYLLRQADLVVIGLKQDPRLLDVYFTHLTGHFSNIMYIIMDYFSKESVSIEKICLDYRIPRQRIARIPYNIRFYEAARRGQAQRYLRFRHEQSGYERYTGFQTELAQTVNLFLKALQPEPYWYPETAHAFPL